MIANRQILAAASTALVLLAATSLPPAIAASTSTPKATKTPAPKTTKTPATIHKLTKAIASSAALKDAEAAASINGGDKVVVSDCRTYGKASYKCAIQLIPVSSSSRCKWTDTISLVKGQPSIKYSASVCSD
jgi:hypothetical protein